MPAIRMCCWFFLLIACFSVCAEPIRIITEDYPPYNYVEDGKLKGLSVDIIKAVMKRTSLEYTLEVLPWARGMVTTERTKNVFIFSMRRVPSREERFLWVGSLCSSAQSIYTLYNRHDIEVDSIEDLNNYTVGTTINDSRETVLIAKGIPVENLTRISGHDSYERNYMKLKFGRIDLWPMDDTVAFHIVKRNGDEPEKVLKKVYSFESGKNDTYYLATNLNTDPEILEQVSRALREFKETEEYSVLLKRWNGAP
ncbi:transporter substrate-binding domain-containing protein [Vibrio sp. JC009]|uniref:substrate-binding periplasmic protein n=1 Tax=Vibrio sp. JC009 TaxID=2912314 RepID=UPI0023B0C949|nr:transporter substrate-binding domain-containing protein [Vibrio sp. JC009]WED24596.1 transporter substrate-binding domain-containing protein [Vibrio sp. JC009]